MEDSKIHILLSYNTMKQKNIIYYYSRYFIL